MQGYVKLYRKLLDNPIFRNPELFQLFCYCLLKANHKKGKAFHGNDEIELEPGQFVTGRNELASVVHQQSPSCYKRLKRLESLRVISLDSNNKNTLVTVLNWELYQLAESDSNNEVTENGTESSRKVAGKWQESSTNKNVRMKEYIEGVERAREGKVFEFYNKNIGPILPRQAEVISQHLDDGIEPEMIIAVMEDSLGKDDKWSWIKRVLDNSFGQNIKTYEQYQAKKVERQSTKSRDKPSKEYDFDKVAEEASRMLREQGILPND